MQPKYTASQILDHDIVWGEMLGCMRRLRLAWELALRRGDAEQASKALEELRPLAGQIFYAHRVWAQRGRWNRFYQVVDCGVLHTGMTCKKIKRHTAFRLLSSLSGMSREVVARQFRLCGHCGRRDTTEVTDEMFNRFFTEYSLFHVST